MKYRIISNDPIVLSDCNIAVETILQAVINTNQTIRNIIDSTSKLSLDLFDAVDFRNLSGVIGELFATELAELETNLQRNPHFHGYPDLIQVATTEMREYTNSAELRGFIHYPYGGVEVKNTFGSKKQKVELFKGDTRIDGINKKLDWKAHHRETNYLLGLFSEYIDGVPCIAAVFFSDQLSEEDWNEKQEPDEDSAMTSFTAIGRTGFQKMRDGMRVCLDDRKYLRFFGVEG